MQARAPSPFSSLLLGLGLVGCSDYQFSTEHQEGHSDETGLVGGDDEDPDSGGQDDPDEDPPDDPPDRIIEDCDGGSLATLPTGEMAVLSWDPTEAAGELVTSKAGWYHVYDFTIAESGSSQTNETARLRVKNSGNPEGLPAFGNCPGQDGGEDWWVVDADNDGDLPEGSRIYVGTFWLEAGTNQVEMSHFCPTWRGGECDSLHITQSSGSTCDSGGVNSVHFLGEGICLVPY